MKVFKWKFKNIPILTYWDLESIVSSASLNYVNTHGFKVEVKDQEVIIDNEVLDLDYIINYFTKIHKRFSDEACKPLFMVINGELARLEVRGENYYKLCQVLNEWAPTLIINGIVMHTLKENPITEAFKKVKYLRCNGIALDTCTGLGYTVHALLRRGARSVITVEIDENVLELSTYNSYSKCLESSEVMIINDSILNVIPEFKDNYFTTILHDPPRLMSETGDLYGQELYKEFYRILKKGGTLFHYTGATGSKYRGLDVLKGVVKRLRDTGFEIVKVIEGFGVFARKS